MVGHWEHPETVSAALAAARTALAVVADAVGGEIWEQAPVRPLSKALRW